MQTMLEEERDCQEIMQQLTAIHSAVQSTSRIFLQDYATTCLTEMDKEIPIGSVSSLSKAKREKLVQGYEFDLIDKTP